MPDGSVASVSFVWSGWEIGVTGRFSIAASSKRNMYPCREVFRRVGVTVSARCHRSLWSPYLKSMTNVMDVGGSGRLAWCSAGSDPAAGACYGDRLVAVRRPQLGGGG